MCPPHLKCPLKSAWVEAILRRCWHNPKCRWYLTRLRSKKQPKPERRKEKRYPQPRLWTNQDQDSHSFRLVFRFCRRSLPSSRVRKSSPPKKRWRRSRKNRKGYDRWAFQLLLANEMTITLLCWGRLGTNETTSGSPEAKTGAFGQTDLIIWSCYDWFIIVDRFILHELNGMWWHWILKVGYSIYILCRQLAWHNKDLAQLMKPSNDGSWVRHRAKLSFTIKILWEFNWKGQSTLWCRTQQPNGRLKFADGQDIGGFGGENCEWSLARPTATASKLKMTVMRSSPWYTIDQLNFLID